MQKISKRMLSAAGAISVSVALLAILSGCARSPDETDQANNLVYSISPLAAEPGQKVFGAASKTGYRIEVFGVLSPNAQNEILKQLCNSIRSIRLRERVHVRFYQGMELREDAQENGWTEKNVIKTGLLREVTFRERELCRA